MKMVIPEHISSTASATGSRVTAIVAIIMICCFCAVSFIPKTLVGCVVLLHYIALVETDQWALLCYYTT